MEIRVGANVVGSRRSRANRQRDILGNTVVLDNVRREGRESAACNVGIDIAPGVGLRNSDIQRSGTIRNLDRKVLPCEGVLTVGNLDTRLDGLNAYVCSIVSPKWSEAVLVRTKAVEYLSSPSTSSASLSYE
jgi:hypothetical protein